MIVFFDFDSTVVTKESLDEAIALELREHADGENLTRKVEDITRLGMEGKLHFLDSIQQRLAIIPLTETGLKRTGEYIAEHVTPGMHEVFQFLEEHDHEAYIVTGGFKECVIPTAKKLGLNESHCITNEFRFENGIAHLNLETSPTITIGKSGVLLGLRAQYPTEKFVMVGDGMNDYVAYEKGTADAFIGFGGNVIREAVRAKPTPFAMNTSELLSFLKALV